jgi:hypothetical protein
LLFSVAGPVIGVAVASGGGLVVCEPLDGLVPELGLDELGVFLVGDLVVVVVFVFVVVVVVFGVVVVFDVVVELLGDLVEEVDTFIELVPPTPPPISRNGLGSEPWRTLG